MNRIVVCLDCPNYRKGGWCTLKNRSIGALDPACADAAKTKEQVINDRHDILNKKCTHCGRLLPVEKFSLNKKSLDGRQSVCKECQKGLYKAWDERRKAKKAEDSETVKDFKEWRKSNNKVIKSETMETTNTSTKKCPRCGRELPLDNFGKHARTKDGLQPYCKECRSQARAGKTSRPGRETKTSYIKSADEPTKRIVVRETLTDKQMVDLLREHGWTVTCEKYEKVEL